MGIQLDIAPTIIYTYICKYIYIYIHTDIYIYTYLMSEEFVVGLGM